MISVKIDDFTVSVRCMGAIIYARTIFLTVPGRHGEKEIRKTGRHLDFLKVARISGFRSNSVHLGRLMGPALIDHRWHREIGKNLDFSDC